MLKFIYSQYARSFISPNLDCKYKFGSIDNLQDIQETFGSKKTPYEHIKEIQSLLIANSK